MSPRVRAFISGFGLTLVVTGAVGVAWYYWQKRQVSKPVTIIPTQTVTQSPSTPSEAPVKKEDFYSVPADQPREINLTSINAQGYIQKVGLDQNNTVVAPGNIHVAGWYTDSVKPGDEGLSIIDGHVSGWYTDGVFKHLSSLKAGDAFTVTYGDNSVRNFKVVEVKTLAVADAGAYLFKQDDAIKNQLNLITCGGHFDRSSAEYDSRVIVKSELLQI
jgi:LPXTG-site transpeptidase (sortase) family protein